MALKPCRECGHKVSTTARRCPRCGEEDPSGHVAITGLFSNVIGLILLLWFVSWTISSCSRMFGH